MSRPFPLAFLSALAACVGVAPSSHPLFIARAPDSAAAAEAPRITVETNSLVFRAPASTLSGCFGLSGDYVRKGDELVVTLKQVAAAQPCDPNDRRPYVSRIGPLPPGSYRVTVSLDGKELIRGERVAIR